MREFISWLKEEESGQGMVEYGVIMVIVIGIAIGAMNTNLRTAIVNLFGRAVVGINGIIVR